MSANCDGQAISNREAFINAGTSKGCDSNMADYIFSIFDKVIGDVVKMVYEGLVGSNYELLLMLGALYLAFYGYRIFSGQSDDTLQEVFWLLIKLTFVYALLFNYSTFHFYVFSFFTNTPHEIWGKTLELSGYQVMNTSNPNKTLTIFFEKGVALAGLAGEIGGVVGYAMNIVVFVGTLLICAAVFLMLLFSKIMTATYLLLAPIFLMMWLFKLTQGAFQNWLQGLFTFWFIPVLTYAVMVFMFGIMQYPLVEISNDLQKRDQVYLSDYYVVLLLGAITYGIFRRLFTLAAQLGGGVALESYKPIQQFVGNNIRPGVQRFMNEKVYGGAKKMLGGG